MSYIVSPQANEDLFEIWTYIAESSEAAANRLQSEIYSAFASLARTPGQGHLRPDLTERNVRFFALYSYLIVYRANTDPIQIVTVVHGRRDVKRLLESREL